MSKRSKKINGSGNRVVKVIGINGIDGGVFGLLTDFSVANVIALFTNDNSFVGPIQQDGSSSSSLFYTDENCQSEPFMTP